MSSSGTTVYESNDKKGWNSYPGFSASGSRLTSLHWSMTEGLSQFFLGGGGGGMGRGMGSLVGLGNGLRGEDGVSREGELGPGWLWIESEWVSGSLPGDLTNSPDSEGSRRLW